MAMKGVTVQLSVVTLGVAVIATACDNDQRVLWQETAGDTAPTTSVTTTGSGGAPMFTSTGPEPPPPLAFCGDEDPEPQVGPCFCPPNAPCACGVLEEPFNEEPCSMICDTDACQFLCEPGRECEGECTQGCELECQPDASCSLLCEGDCTLICDAGSTCHLYSWGGPSQLLCLQGATCFCEFEENCECIGTGCMP